MLRSKTWTKLEKGETILYAQEIANDLPDYPAILKALSEHIEIGDLNENYEEPPLEEIVFSS